MPSSRMDSHQNSEQNGMVEKFTALTATIFVPNFISLSPPLLPTPMPKNVVITKACGSKFFAEWTDRHIHSSLHGTRGHFYVCVSGQLSGPGIFQATPGQLSDNFWATFGPATFGQLSVNLKGNFCSLH